jgi:glycosyltransferase involved in cell wall biosynthesis
VLALRTFRSALGAIGRAPVMVLHALRLRRFLAAHRVDVVVVSMEQIWQAPILAMAGRGRRRMLLCVHDAAMHPGQFNHAENLLLNLHRALADGAMTFSNHVATTLESTGRFDRSRIWRSVHAAYGTVRDSPRPAPDAEVPTVGFFGRLSAYKGLGLAYDAVELLRRSGRRVRFSVVGNGQDPALDRMVHEDDRVEVRWVDDEQIPAALDSFDVLLLPYLEASQSGVFAYAMSRGVPMVVTPVGGLLEQAEGTGAAAIAADVSAPAVAHALEALLDDPARYGELSAKGLAAARDTYSWARTADDVLVAAAALADARRRAAPVASPSRT